jgi:hypothetical protein
MSSSDTDKRAEYIAGLRAFADLVESDPTIPTPTLGVVGTDVWAHIHQYDNGLTEDERFGLIHDFDDAHDVTVTEDHKGDRQAKKTFGPVTFHVCAYADKQPEAHIVTRPRTRQPELAAV